MITDEIERSRSKFQTGYHMISINPHEIITTINQSSAYRICILDVYTENLKGRTIQKHYTLVNILLGDTSGITYQG